MPKRLETADIEGIIWLWDFCEKKEEKEEKIYTTGQTEFCYKNYLK